MSNVDRVTDYIISNAGKLQADKIVALSQVIRALGNENEAPREPNTIPVAETQEDLVQAEAIDFNEVENLQVNDGPIRRINIVKAEYAGSET